MRLAIARGSIPRIRIVVKVLSIFTCQYEALSGIVHLLRGARSYPRIGYAQRQSVVNIIEDEDNDLFDRSIVSLSAAEKW